LEGLAFIHGQNVAVRVIEILSNGEDKDTFLCRYYFHLTEAVHFPARTGQSVTYNLRWVGTQPPEEASGEYDPFPADVYLLGSLIDDHRENMRVELGTFDALMSEMKRPDPLTRPSIEEVLGRFRELYTALSEEELQAAVIPDYYDDDLACNFSLTSASPVLETS
jgi:hypothetical protein